MPLRKANIFCGICIVPPDVPDNASLSDEVRCPECAQTDTVSRVLSDARKHATHQAARALERTRIEKGETVNSRTQTRAPYKRLRWISGQSADL